MMPAWLACKVAHLYLKTGPACSGLVSQMSTTLRFTLAEMRPALYEQQLLLSRAGRLSLTTFLVFCQSHHVHYQASTLKQHGHGLKQA